MFDASELKLDGIAELTREAIRRIDAESGTVDLILVRRNLPDSEDVRLRVYDTSPRKAATSTPTTRRRCCSVVDSQATWS